MLISRFYLISGAELFDLSQTTESVLSFYHVNWALDNFKIKIVPFW